MPLPCPDGQPESGLADQFANVWTAAAEWIREGRDFLAEQILEGVLAVRDLATRHVYRAVGELRMRHGVPDLVAERRYFPRLRDVQERLIAEPGRAHLPKQAGNEEEGPFQAHFFEHSERYFVVLNQAVVKGQADNPIQRRPAGGSWEIAQRGDLKVILDERPSAVRTRPDPPAGWTTGSGRGT